MDEEYDKAIGQFKLLVANIMNPLRMYGQGVYVDSVVDEVVSLAVQLHQRLSGLDAPYVVNHNKLHW